MVDSKKRHSHNLTLGPLSVTLLLQGVAKHEKVEAGTS